MNRDDGRRGPCNRCGREMATKTTYKQHGVARYHGNGICDNCAKTQMRRTGGQLHRPVLTPVKAERPARLLLPLTPTWMLKAPCRTSGDPDLWHADHDDRNAHDKTRAAKWVCRTQCRYTAPCLTWAVEHKEREGVWGGLTKTEREGLSLERLEEAA